MPGQPILLDGIASSQLYPTVHHKIILLLMDTNRTRTRLYFVPVPCANPLFDVHVISLTVNYSQISQKLLESLIKIELFHLKQDIFLLQNHFISAQHWSYFIGWNNLQATEKCHSAYCATVMQCNQWTASKCVSWHIKPVLLTYLTTVQFFWVHQTRCAYLPI